MGNFTFVLAVYNKLNLTKQCYKFLRDVYPTTPLVISSGGSTDETETWLKSLNDSNLKFIHTNTRISFSETYNVGISNVETEKLVLIHNDMVIGEGFIESLERLLTPDMLLSYTTIEPPIFAGHWRPGKVILDLGSGFENFDSFQFNNFVRQWNGGDKLYDGAVFFMSGYKKMFEDIGGFDGKTFFPCFCEDDDFLLRAKLKGYKLKTCDSAITYHFVSQTSRFSDEMQHKRIGIERSSIRNFVRKWGLPIYSFNQIEYWNIEDFNYKKLRVGLTTSDYHFVMENEPYFDKINLGYIPEEYIKTEQKHTIVDLKSKFLDTDDVDVMIHISSFTPSDGENLSKIRLVLSDYEPGFYEVGNLKIEIKVSDL